MADPICTFLFSVFVLFTTFTIIRDILLVLMEGESQENCSNIQTSQILLHTAALTLPASGAPAGLKYSDVRDGLLAVDGVTAVHNLHIWALTMNQAVLTAHVAIGERAVVDAAALDLRFIVLPTGSNVVLRGRAAMCVKHDRHVLTWRFTITSNSHSSQKTAAFTNYGRLTPSGHSKFASVLSR